MEEISGLILLILRYRCDSPYQSHDIVRHFWRHGLQQLGYYTFPVPPAAMTAATLPLDAVLCQLLQWPL